MKLEVGKFYKTRDGRKAEWMPKEKEWKSSYPVLVRVFGSPDGWLSHTATGEYWSSSEPHDLDLIAEWTDTPTIGTLADINAQVGDVVEWQEDNGTSEHHKVTGGATHYGDTWPNHMQLDGEYAVDVNDSTCRFRIVSRASDYQPDESECVEAAMAKGIDYPAQPKGPVITETVTTKRIVPGVYGKVSVGFDGPNGELLVDVTQGLLQDDLIAARDVFNQLIDAMPHE